MRTVRFTFAGGDHVDVPEGDLKDAAILATNLSRPDSVLTVVGSVNGDPANLGHVLYIPVRHVVAAEVFTPEPESTLAVATTKLPGVDPRLSR